MVAHLVWDQGVEGSNPFAPTKNIKGLRTILRKPFFLFSQKFQHVCNNTMLPPCSPLYVDQPAPRITKTEQERFSLRTSHPAYLKNDFRPRAAVTHMNDKMFVIRLRYTVTTGQQNTEWNAAHLAKVTVFNTYFQFFLGTIFALKGTSV